jgi:hypothetical protein
LKTSNLILDFEFDQHLGSHKHVINIIMWFRDMGRYSRTATTSTMEAKPCALAPSPPAVFNVGHDARYIPHHEGYSTTAQGGPPEEHHH